MASSLEKIKLTCRQQFQNPPGKNSRQVAARHVIKEGMKLKYANLLKKWRKEFKCYVYKFPNMDLMYHVTIPSQSFDENKIRYDTLIYIPYGDDPIINKSPIDYRPAYFFTNSPSFAFTYAWVYKERGIFFEEFADKMPSLCLTMPPNVTNPEKSLGYDYGLYIALLYIYSINGFSERVIDLMTVPANEFNQSILKRRVATVDTLLDIHKITRYENAKKHNKKMHAGTERKLKSNKNRYIQNQSKYNQLIKPKKPLGKIGARKAVKRIMNKK